jgi:4'-phosphopantetheinyl transferase
LALSRRGTDKGMESTHRIAVWTVALQDVPEALWPSLGALLDEAEQARAKRFAFDRHRRQYIAAHALKRLMLSSLHSTPASAWRFQTALGGKPTVSGTAGPHFNLSHCEGLAACAVSSDLEIGIDIEELTREAPREVIGQCFTLEEQHWLASRPVSEQAEGFFRLWTLKEALVKATGGGLAQSLQDISFGFDPLRVVFRNAAFGDAAIWRFDQRMIRRQHLLALAWRAEAAEASVVLREIKLETLLAEVP